MTNILARSGRLIVLYGAIAGLTLGCIARAWMRWISTEPEFTWGGTIGIILGFVFFGAMQATVLLFRGSGHSKLSTRLVRALGVLFTFPLFLAAGAQMFPTVLTASLAKWRTDLSRATKVLLITVSLLIPIKVILDIGSDFSWNLATIGRILLFISIYSIIVVATAPTVASQRTLKI